MLRLLLPLVLVTQTLFSLTLKGNIAKRVADAKWEGFANTITVAQIESTDFSPDGNYVSFLYQLKKAVTMTGAKELGSFSFPYDSLYWSVEIKRARIIKPSGEIVSVDTGSIKDEPMKSMFGLIFYGSLREKTINFAGVEPGSGIELEVLYRTKKPRIEGVFDGKSFMQDEEPILYCRTVITGPKGVRLFTAVVNDTAGRIKFEQKERGKKQKFVWESSDVPPIIAEKGMAPAEDFVPQVLYSTTTWRELSKKVHELVEPMMVSDSLMEAKVKELINGVDDEEERMRRIFYYVAQEIRYVGLSLGEREGIQPHPAVSTFARQEGVCKDKATLLATMLRLAGIDAYTVLTNPTGRIFKDVAVSHFSHMVTAARLKNGKLYFMDSTDEYARDLLPAYSYNKEYLPILPEGSDLLSFPLQNPDENSETVYIRTKISFDGSLNAEVQFKPKGFYDELWRMILMRLEGEQKKQFFTKIAKSIHPESRLESFTIEPQHLKDLSRPVSILLKISCQNYAIPAGKYIMLKPAGYASGLNILDFLLETLTTLEKRSYPVDMNLTYSHTVVEEISPPVGFGVELMPDERVCDNEIALYRISLEGGSPIIFKCSFVLKNSYIQPQDYFKLKSVADCSRSGEKGFIFLVKEEK